MYTEVATRLFWIAMHGLHDAPPSVHPRGEKLVSVPTWEELNWERALFRDTRRRYNEEWSEEWSEEGGESEEYYENDEEELSEEESIA